MKCLCGPSTLPKQAKLVRRLMTDSFSDIIIIYCMYGIQQNLKGYYVYMICCIPFSLVLFVSRCSDNWKWNKTQNFRNRRSVQKMCAKRRIKRPYGLCGRHRLESTLMNEFDLTNSMNASVNSAHAQCFNTAYQNEKYIMINVLFSIWPLINTSTAASA